MQKCFKCGITTRPIKLKSGDYKQVENYLIKMSVDNGDLVVISESGRKLPLSVVGEGYLEHSCNRC